MQFIAIAVGLLSYGVLADNTEPTHTPAQIEQLKQALEMHNQGFLASRAGRYAEAIQCTEKAISLRKTVLGDSHPHYALSVHNLADIYRDAGDFAKAEPTYRLAIEAYARALGDQSYEYARSVDHLANMFTRKKEYAKAEPLYLLAIGIYRKGGPQDPHSRSAISWLASAYESTFQFAKAERLLTEQVEIERKAAGEQHVDFVNALINLAIHFENRGQYPASEPLLLQALDINAKLFGEQSVPYAEVLREVGHHFQRTGEYGKAEPAARRAVEMERKLLGPEHYSYGKCLEILGTIRTHLGDYKEAESLYRQSTEIIKKTRGEWDSEYASELNNLAVVYVEIGDFAKAEKMYLQTLEIERRASGKNSLDYVIAMTNLSEIYHRSGDYARAVSLDLQTLDIARVAVGTQHPSYSGALIHLAESYRGLREFTKAEPLYLQALEIQRKTIGEQHPDYATSLHNLALLYRNMGDYAKAEPLFIRSLETTRRVYGEEHILTGTSLKNLALLYALMGDELKAESVGRRALTLVRDYMERVAVLQSEREQISLDQGCRVNLYAYLTFSDLAKTAASQVYREVANWKGTVWVRQREMRELRHLKAGDAMGVSPDDRREAGRLCDELTLATSNLGKILGAPVDPRAIIDAEARRVRSERLAAISDRINQLQSDLALRSETYRKLLRQTHRNTDDLIAALPEGTALVDIFEYSRTILRKQKDQADAQEPWLVAFVVRHGKEVERVELGSSKVIADDIDLWRQGKIDETAAASSAGRRLLKAIWEPLVGRLADAKTIIISPDGPISRISFAALPGDKAGTYLIEDFSFSTVAVPQALPELLASKGPDGPPSMLIVGDVDYGLPDGHGGPIATALPGTKIEMQAIQTLFQTQWPTAEVKTLHGTDATKSAFHFLASTRWIHLATHGYFAPPQRAAASFNGEPNYGNLHPGLRSGIVLAGVNHSPLEGTNDAILTALEVQEMDLATVDLAVLSACETGLGLTAGGEGMLGLQRAFQIAGARTVVASLWSVDDRAMQQLMVRFYQNFWISHMGKQQALREAQLQMLRGPQGVLTSPRQLPAKYWAAFVLSGDER